MLEPTQPKKKEGFISSILKAASQFKDRDYPLVVRIINDHLVISSPDFQFPVPIVLPFNPPRIDTAGKGLLAAWLQIADYIKELHSRGESPPTPKEMNEFFPKLMDEISLGEACRILGIKPDMLRSLSDEGKIPHSRTPKGHRRYSRIKLFEYIEKNR